MAFEFNIVAWGAFAPALELGSTLPVVPDFIPKTLQRRLTPMAKGVFHAISQCVEPDEHLPAVFSSTHGEIGKSFQLLESLQAGEELSPTAFSLSVHNGIAGLYSMAYGNRCEISVLAPASGGLGSGFLEAVAMSREGHRQVLLVFYDETVPDFYPLNPFKLTAATPCSLALKLATCGDGLALHFELSSESRQDGEQPLQLPAFIKFLASEQTTLRLGDQGRNWQWQKL